jgi:hypothetical protein
MKSLDNTGKSSAAALAFFMSSEAWTAGVYDLEITFQAPAEDCAG